MASYTYAQIDSWVKQYAPRVIFHPDEKFYPSSADWYLDRTCLVSREAENVNDKRRDCKIQGTISTECPSSNCKDYSEPSVCSYFNIQNNSSFNSTTYGDLSSAICYVHVKGVNDYIELQYMFFEPFNGGAHASFEAKWFGYDSTVSTGPVGSHQGDWEHITVRINSTGELIGVFYAQHSHGNWLTPTTTPFAVDNHPVVYSALHTHASYPSSGVFNLYDKKNGVIVDPSATWFGVKIGGADITGSGKQWDTWNNNGSFLQILKIDGLTVSNDPTVSPDWLNFKGFWGGPFEYHYSTWDIASAITSFAWAFAKANPLIAATVTALAAYIIPLIVTVGGVIPAISIATGISIVTLYFVFKEIRNFLSDGESLGPEGPTSKSYWKNGETTPFNTGVNKMKNGSSQIKIKFSPGCAITTFGKNKNDIYVFYSSRGNTFYFEKSSDDGSSWTGQKKVSSVDIHSSPAGLFYKKRDLKFLYAFFQDKNKNIRYSITSDGSNWSTKSPLSYQMAYNSGMSVTQRGDQIYMVYPDTSKKLKLVSGTVTEDGTIDNWQRHTVDPSIGSIDSPAYIVNYQESLFITYKKDGSNYMWKCYIVVKNDDDTREGVIKWGGPSVYPNTEIPTTTAVQPAVVNDQLFLIFSNYSVPDNAVTNLNAVSTIETDDPDMFNISKPFSLGISLNIDHNMGLASSIHDGPLFLALRKEDSEYLYSSSSYIG